jgi:hypothetical protein
MGIIGVDEAVMDELFGTSSCSIKDKDLLSRSEIPTSLTHRSSTFRLEIRRKLLKRITQTDTIGY